MFFDEGFAGVFFSRVKQIYFGDLGDKRIFEVNGVVKWVMRGKLFISLLRNYVSKVHTEFWNGCVLGFLRLGNLG